MSVSGLCEICEQRDVEHTCDRCGKLVCERHWDDGTGVCVECAAQFGEHTPDPNTPDDEDLPDGVDTYEF